jgi:hypothetical protein
MASPNLLRLQYIKTGTKFVIKMPLIDKRDPYQSAACLRIELFVSVVPGVHLENLGIYAHQLSVQKHDGFDVDVTNRTTIELDIGSVEALQLQGDNDRSWVRICPQ